MNNIDIIVRAMYELIDALAKSVETPEEAAAVESMHAAWTQVLKAFNTTIKEEE